MDLFLAMINKFILMIYEECVLVTLSVLGN